MQHQADFETLQHGDGGPSPLHIAMRIADNAEEHGEEGVRGQGTGNREQVTERGWVAVVMDDSMIIACVAKDSLIAAN